MSPVIADAWSSWGLAACSLARPHCGGPAYRHASCNLPAEQAKRSWRPVVGKILIGVIIGVILMIWLLVSCVSAVF